jgi:hypothetical protein
MFGQLHVLPFVQSFLDEHPQINVRLLLDEVVYVFLVFWF